MPAIKYHEGCWAALHEVSARVWDSSQEVSTAALASRRDWNADLERRIAAGASADWIAYRRGGIEALTDLLSIAPLTREA